MLRIDCKSPDRVPVLLVLDAAGAEAVVEQSDKFANYKIWCVGVGEQVLRDKLSKACQHPFQVHEDNPPELGKAGGPM
jgi:hypothetical protein